MHVGELQQAVADDDLTASLIHAEHVVNIIDGESGFVYGDLNRDDERQNAGDGYGLSVYLNDAHAQFTTLQDALDTPGMPADTAEHLAIIITEIENSQELATEAIQIALKVFASDTTSEAGGFGNELQLLADNVADSTVIALGTATKLATFRFYAAERELVADVVSAAASLPDPAVDLTAAGNVWTDPVDGIAYVYVPPANSRWGLRNRMQSPRQSSRNTRCASTGCGCSRRKPPTPNTPAAWRMGDAPHRITTSGTMPSTLTTP